MAKLPTELGQSLARPTWTSPIVPITANVDLDATATRTVPLFKAPRKMFFKSATFMQELDADGTKTVKLRNLTTSVDITSALDVAALAALAGADMVMGTNAARTVAKGDLIGIVYTVSVAGTVACGECVVAVAAQVLDVIK